MTAGKGDTRRPSRVSRQEYERRWEKAFGGGHPPERCGVEGCPCMGGGSWPDGGPKIILDDVTAP